MARRTTARTPPKDGAADGRPAPPQRRTHLTIALLIAAAGVLGGAIYLAVAPSGKSTSLPLGEPGPSPAERTRRAVEELLARADRMDPKAGPHAVLARSQGYEAACELARKYVRLSDPRDVVVRPVLARAQLRLGRMQDAERTIDDLLRLAPASAEGLWLKGELVRARGGQRAMQFFRLAAESDQATPELWSRYGTELRLAGRLDEARKYLLRAEQAGLHDRPTLMGLAALAMNDERFPRAEQLLQKLVTAGQSNARVLAMLAEARIYLDKLAEAERDLRLALEEDDSPELRVKLGDVLVLQKRRAEAAEEYARAAEHPAVEGLASYKAAQCCYFLGKYALAMKYIDRAAELAQAPDVTRWQRKIEDARFGAPAEAPGGAFQLPRGPAGDTASPPPAGGVLGELLGRSTTQPTDGPE